MAAFRERTFFTRAHRPRGAWSPRARWRLRRERRTGSSWRHPPRLRFVGCGRPPARYAARLSGALLLQVLRVAPPLRLREGLQRETERAWPITLAGGARIPRGRGQHRLWGALR